MNPQDATHWKLTNKHTQQVVYCESEPNMDGNLHDGWNPAVWKLEPPKGMGSDSSDPWKDANPFAARAEPPSWFELREERDELAVEVRSLSLQLERQEDLAKSYKHRGDMLQSALMTLREEALNFARLYDECVDRTKLGGAVELLQQRARGADATLAAFGEDPY